MRRFPRFDFILNCARVSEFFISKGTMFHIFGPRYLSALKPQLIVLLTLTESQFVSGGYIGYSSIIGAARFSFVLYSSVANILRFLT